MTVEIAFWLCLKIYRLVQEITTFLPKASFPQYGFWSIRQEEYIKVASWKVAAILPQKQGATFTIKRSNFNWGKLHYKTDESEEKVFNLTVPLPDSQHLAQIPTWTGCEVLASAIKISGQNDRMSSRISTPNHQNRHSAQPIAELLAF